MRQARYVARMGDRCAYRVFVDKPEGKIPSGRLWLEGKIILK